MSEFFSPFLLGLAFCLLCQFPICIVCFVFSLELGLAVMGFGSRPSPCLLFMGVSIRNYLPKITLDNAL